MNTPNTLDRTTLLLTYLPLDLLHAEKTNVTSPELKPVTSLLTHKLFLHTDYEPYETHLGEDHRTFFNLRYEPSYR